MVHHLPKHGYAQSVQGDDAAILKYLRDVRGSFQTLDSLLEFRLERNDYFPNSVLRKTYEMKSEPDKAYYPFSFEGPEIVDLTGALLTRKKENALKRSRKSRNTRVEALSEKLPSKSPAICFSASSVCSRKHLAMKTHWVKIPET